MRWRRLILLAVALRWAIGLGCVPPEPSLAETNPAGSSAGSSGAGAGPGGGAGLGGNGAAAGLGGNGAGAAGTCAGSVKAATYDTAVYDDPCSVYAP